MDTSATLQRPVDVARPVLWEIPAMVVVAAVGWGLQSYPGTWPVPILGGLVCGIVMIAQASASVVVRAGRRRFVAAVMTALLVAALSGAVSGWSLRARFLASSPGFDAVVAEAGPPPAAAPGFDRYEFPADCPAEIGSYRISSCQAVTGGYLFFESNGGFFDQAGFAYLPGGAATLGSDGSFELQSVEHLHGDWYAFVNSW